MSANRFTHGRRAAFVRGGSLLLGLAAVGCKKNGHTKNPHVSAATATFDASTATQWMSLMYDAVKHASISPPVSSRAFGYAGVALYESVVPGISDHRSLAGQVNGLDSVPQPTDKVDYRVVANTALHDIIGSTAIIPNLQAGDITAIDTLETTLNDLYDDDDAADVFLRSVDLGDDIAVAILAWAAADGYTTFHNCAFTPPVGTGLWVSLNATAPVEP